MIHISIDEELCKGCGLCTGVCPKGITALSAEKLNSKGFHPAEITNKSACIGCASCAANCPEIAIAIEQEEGI